jgi:hypothetical protein
VLLTLTALLEVALRRCAFKAFFLNRKAPFTAIVSSQYLRDEKTEAFVVSLTSADHIIPKKRCSFKRYFSV